jgi:hypothetical protein
VFPLGIITYVKIGLCAFLLCGAAYIGYSVESARFDRYKNEQMDERIRLTEEHQTAADQIRKEKDAQIAAINSSLADALVQLRSRPSRTQATNNGQGGTGLSLSAEDASFLEREAAGADTLRSALSACYQQYDSLNK